MDSMEAQGSLEWKREAEEKTASEADVTTEGLVMQRRRAGPPVSSFAGGEMELQDKE